MFRSPKDVSVTIFESRSVNSNTLVEYYCDLCSRGPWSTESDVDIHRKSVHQSHIMKTLRDKNRHMCSICLKEQKDKQSLIEHILVYHLYSAPNATRIDRQIFICDYCQRLFFNKQLLVCHIYHWHTVKSKEIMMKKINCPKCWKGIRCKSVWFHLLYHGTFNIGTCPICLRPCESTEELLKHITSHPRYFSCDICGYETFKQVCLNKHMEMHRKKSVKSTANSNVGRFFLPQKFYPSIKNRMCHIFKGIPLSNAINICVMCRTLCVTKEEMKQHILGDHAPEEEVKSKTHMCVCGEVFFNAVLLKHHIFKMKDSGYHLVWDGVSPIIPQAPREESEVLYEVYEITASDSTEAKNIFIAGVANTEVAMKIGEPISIEYVPMDS